MENKNVIKFKFEFTEDEINAVLSALAKEPYIQVFELIAGIQNQYLEMTNKK